MSQRVAGSQVTSSLSKTTSSANLKWFEYSPFITNPVFSRSSCLSTTSRHAGNNFGQMVSGTERTSAWAVFFHCESGCLIRTICTTLALPPAARASVACSGCHDRLACPL